MHTILFLLDRYPAFGGIETVTTLLANRLVERYRVILCAQRGTTEESMLQQLDPRITYHRLPEAARGCPSEMISCFHDFLHANNVDLVIYQDSYAPNTYLPLSIRKESGIRLIVAEHSSPSHAVRWLSYAKKTCPWWKVLRLGKLLLLGERSVRDDAARRTRLYDHCNRYVLLSRSLRQEFLQYSNTTDTAKLCDIGNPISYQPRQIEFSAKKKQVLFIGQFVELKGIDRLLRIWSKIEPQMPDWSLILVGDGPSAPQARAFIRKAGLKRAVMEGFRSNIQDYCCEASILCMCSTFEGFPMVLPEAMCSGTVPIVFASFAAQADIFSDGISGYSIPPYDEDVYAERLLRLMQNDELRESMARAALTRADKFNLTRITHCWEETIENTLSE